MFSNIIHTEPYDAYFSIHGATSSPDNKSYFVRVECPVVTLWSSTSAIKMNLILHWWHTHILF